MFEDLLEQARVLAKLDTRGKPRQANLRRAVSSLYYALFHFLVERACRAIIGSQNLQRGYRDALARGFSHSTMKSACASFEAGSLPNSVSKPLPKNGQGQVLIEPEIRKLAFVFRDLQNMRHLADYDPSERFERSEVLSLIDAVEAEIRAFEGLAATDRRHFFLVCLLTWKELLGRPG